MNHALDRHIAIFRYDLLMNTTTSAPRVLIVHAHPEPASFSTAQANVAAETLRASGYEVDFLDLYAEGWTPILDRGEFPNSDGPFKPQTEQMKAVKNGTLDPLVKEHLDRLLAADLLVLSFPLWWFSVPAILKGWIDRVFVMGALFGGDYGLFDQAAQVGKQAVLSITTGGAEESYLPGGMIGDMDVFLFHIHRGMLEVVGYSVLDPIVIYAPAHIDDDERDTALETVRQRFALLSPELSLVS
jgi:NAD(P)H dehydrogenase (quinone)